MQYTLFVCNHYNCTLVDMHYTYTKHIKGHICVAHKSLKTKLIKLFSFFQVHIIMFGHLQLITVDKAVRPDADRVGLLLVGSKTQACCTLIWHWDPSWCQFRASSPTSGQGDFSTGGALAILDGNWLKNRNYIKSN